MARRTSFDAYVVDGDGYCECCEDDDHPEGTPPMATLVLGPGFQPKRMTLCSRCLEELAELITFVRFKYGKGEKI